MRLGADEIVGGSSIDGRGESGVIEIEELPMGGSELVTNDGTIGPQVIYSQEFTDLNPRNVKSGNSLSTSNEALQSFTST